MPRIEDLVWPAERLAEGIEVLASTVGLPAAPRAPRPSATALDPGDTAVLQRTLDSAAAHQQLDRRDFHRIGGPENHQPAKHRTL